MKVQAVATSGACECLVTGDLVGGQCPQRKSVRASAGLRSGCEDVKTEVVTKIFWMVTTRAAADNPEAAPERSSALWLAAADSDRVVR